MKSVISFFVSRAIFVNLLTAIVLIVGGYFTLTMNRLAFPNISFDIVTVNTIWPGASANEVEKLITIPIEEELKTVDDLDKIQSTSLENRSGIAIWIDPDAQNAQSVIDDIRSAVDRVSDLPDEAENPLIEEVGTSRQPIIEIAFAIKEKDGKPAMSEMELRDYVYRFEKRVLDLNEVSNVVRRGWRDREMLVELNPQQMLRYYVSSNQVITAIDQKNINLPGGKLKTPKEELFVRTLGEFEKAEEIGRVYVRSNDLGSAIRVKDIAKVSNTLEEKDYLDRTNGLNSISLTVVKKEKADAIDTVDKTLALMEKFKKKLPPTVEVYEVDDLSYFVRRRLNVLVNNASAGVVLVIASLFLFLSWKVGLMVALGMITAMAGTFLYMGYAGHSLNLLSMFGLVIVIGMVVDDAIIVAENIYRNLEEGLSPYDAAIKGASEVVAPVTATIVTSVAAFAPLLFMSGIMGKFVVAIPLVIIITLISSLIESFFLLPSHVYEITKTDKNAAQAKKDNIMTKIQNRLYTPSLNWALNHRGVSILIMNLLLIGSIALLISFGKFKLFSGSVDRVQVKVEAPRGNSLEQTDQYMRLLERMVAQLPASELDNYTTRVGIVSRGASDPQTYRGTNYGQIMIYLTPETERERSTDTIVQEFRQKTRWLVKKKEKIAKGVIKKDKVHQKTQTPRQLKKEVDQSEKAPPPQGIPKDIPQDIPIEEGQISKLRQSLSKLEFDQQQSGPPVGKAISVEIRGPDFATLKEIGNQYKKTLKKIEGARDISDDMGMGKSEVRVKVDERKANYVGVSVFEIASAIRTAFEGTVATSIRNTREEIDVRVRFPENYRDSLSALNHVYVGNRQGQLIPLTRLVRFERGVGIEYINHLDDERVLRVQANVNENKTTSAEVNAQLKDKFAGIESKYPGYTVAYGGENEDTEESMASLGRAFIIAAFIIFLILSSLFRSMMLPAVIMMAIPFAFIGVIIAFVTHGEYFGFLAIMGVVGLSGIVVNDSIILVNFANKIRGNTPEKSPKQVALEAGQLRLRAVLLTTATTVLGLLPTVYGIGGYDPFLVPAALAFAWGLAFSTVITLIIVPILYTWVFDIKAFFARILLGQGKELQNQE